jgi:hypothetical protein
MSAILSSSQEVAIDLAESLRPLGTNGNAGGFLRDSHHAQTPFCLIAVKQFIQASYEAAGLICWSRLTISVSRPPPTGSPTVKTMLNWRSWTGRLHDAQRSSFMGRRVRRRLNLKEFTRILPALTTVYWTYMLYTFLYKAGRVYLRDI